MAAGGLALVSVILWFAWFSGYPRQLRRAVLFAPVIALAMAALVIRIPPRFDGDMRLVGFDFRWDPPRDALLPRLESAHRVDEWTTTEFDYPRFLGVDGRATVVNVRLDPDWQTHPPEQLWLREIGAGWSGFAVVGDYAFTHEQRGGEELVVCYSTTSGDVVWSHGEAARFDGDTVQASLGGSGPRATPTVHDGRVFAHGATGLLLCLDAQHGDLLWCHDTISEFGGSNVVWGKSGSPLVVGHNVVISVGAPEGKSLIAFDMTTGHVAWSGGERQCTYASPVLAEIAGELQILAVNEDYVTSHRASDGEVLWEVAWDGRSGSNPANSQPVVVSKDRLFLSKGYGHGAALFQITKEDNAYRATPLWKPAIRTVMKTKMSNVVVRDGFVYGLDGGILQCIELDTGSQQWKKGRYGHGQIMLVDDLILVLAESGEVALVKASPTRHEELCRFQAIEGVTWNNPALAGSLLLVRNAEQAACYRLPVLGSGQP